MLEIFHVLRDQDQVVGYGDGGDLAVDISWGLSLGDEPCSFQGMDCCGDGVVVDHGDFDGKEIDQEGLVGIFFLRRGHDVDPVQKLMPNRAGKKAFRKDFVPFFREP